MKVDDASSNARGRARGPASTTTSTPARLPQGDGVDEVRVAQLPQRLAFDQPDALARQTEHLAGLPKRQRLPVLEPVAERNHVALALVQDAVDRAADLLAEERVLDFIERSVGVDLFDEVAQLGVLAHRRLEGQRLPSTHLGQVVD